MSVIRNLIGFGLLASMLVAVTAGAADKPAYSGFLEDYSGFEQSKKVPSAWRRMKPGVTPADFKKYNKIMLDPIQVWVHDKARYKGVDPNELKAMTDYFRKAIVKAMAPDYPVVGNPGEDVLRVSMAITGIIPVKPKRSPMSYVPIGFVLTTAKGAVDSAGGKESVELEASMEAAFYDSTSGERMFAVVDSHRGDDMLVEKGQADLGWESAKPALDFWATVLRERFDETHGKVEEDSPFSSLDAG